jgi:general secretion pathway protein G
MPYNKGFNFVELVIVVIIIGILVSFAIPQFGTTKERALDKEANVNLKLIQAAEKIYRMENTFYYPNIGTAVTSEINTNLKLSLPESNVNWSYVADSAGKGESTRTGAGARVWTLPVNQEEPTCAGANCP